MSDFPITVRVQENFEFIYCVMISTDKIGTVHIGIYLFIMIMRSLTSS